MNTEKSPGPRIQGIRHRPTTTGASVSQPEILVNGTEPSPMLTAALYYVDHGCFVVPCCTMTEKGNCTFHRAHTSTNSIGKVPICGEEWQNARFTREEVTALWTQYPTANVGVLLEPSGLLVIDPDSPEAQEEAATLGLPPGAQIKTGKGTQHYFKNPRGIIASTTRKGTSGQIDILAQGMVVGAGSMHRFGVRYAWLVTWEEWPELEDPPLWAEQLLLDALKAKSAAVDIPDELAPVDLEVIGAPRWLQHVIIHGQPSHGERYKSRSEAVWAVVTALVEAGHSNEVMASILCDRRYRISAKPRESGLRWLAAELGRARAKTRVKVSTPQPQEPSAEAPSPGASFTTEGAADGGKNEEEENARIFREERAVDELWHCPNHMWRGPFSLVADATGKQTWEVWAATLAALGARAHRNIDYKYHRRLFGMAYLLLIKGTGMGKGVSTDLCHGLMPQDYVVRDAVQSGQALASILADILRDKKGKVVSISSHPALLLIEEFTVLLKNAGIPNSTLLDTLNALFHRTWAWNISRSDRPNSGGGDAVIRNPTLSIFATTTEALFKEHVSPQMIRSGFVNRFLVLPGDTTPWKFYDPEGAGKIIDQHLDLFGHIPNHRVGDGKTVWDAYEPDALARMVTWGTSYFEPIMQSGSLDAETVKRLHLYAHVINLLYMWGDQRERINLPDVECAISAITTAHDFLQSLMTAERDPNVPHFKVYEINLEQRILAKVTTAAEQGIRRRKVIHDMAGKTATSPDLNHLISKMVVAETLVEVAEPTAGAARPTHKLYLPEFDPERKKEQKKGVAKKGESHDQKNGCETLGKR